MSRTELQIARMLDPVVDAFLEKTMPKKTKLERTLQHHFETVILKHTCFDSVKDVLADKTDFRVNIVRCLIAVDLRGIYKGMKIGAQIANELSQKP